MGRLLPMDQRLQQQQRAAYLIARFIKNRLSDEEKIELDAFIQASDGNMQLFTDLTDDKVVNDFLQWYHKKYPEDHLKKIKSKIRFGEPAKVVHFWRYAAAIIIFLTVGTIIYFIAFRSKVNDQVISKSEARDIQPGSQLATLRLSANQVIVLNNQRDTVISDQVQIVDGEIIYSSGGSEVAIHELSIPRKGFHKLKLPDGTQVWLNSESSISYPSSFTGAERRVTVTGETYFEVAKNPSKPFIVSVDGTEVKALGTAFNINAYTNEHQLRTTLIEGKVDISHEGKHQILEPCQQLDIAGDKWKVHNVNTDAIAAWVANKFIFKDMPINEAMRMIERWYDAKVIYEEAVNLHINGEIDRSLPVSHVLNQLIGATGQVHFRIDGNTIYVRQ